MYPVCLFPCEVLVAAGGGRVALDWVMDERIGYLDREYDWLIIWLGWAGLGSLFVEGVWILGS